MAFGRNKIVVQPSWHPNFRIVETLPDTKVIRTDFAFNGVFVVIAVVLLGLLGWLYSRRMGREGQKRDVGIRIGREWQGKEDRWNGVLDEL